MSKIKPRMFLKNYQVEDASEALRSWLEGNTQSQTKVCLVQEFTEAQVLVVHRGGEAFTSLAEPCWPCVAATGSLLSPPPLQGTNCRRCGRPRCWRPAALVAVWCGCAGRAAFMGGGGRRSVAGRSGGSGSGERKTEESG